MNKNLRSSKYLSYLTLVIFVIIFTITLILFDVNSISDLFFNFVSSLQAYRFFSLSLILGGALGNLIDRFFTTFDFMSYNGVIDFIDIGINEYRFYIFNFADFFISLGIILYLISLIKSKIINE